MPYFCSMKKATPKDKALIVQILAKAFLDVPGLRWITGGGSTHQYKLTTLLHCAIDLTFHQGEIWLSDDEKAVVLLFDQKNRRFSWRAAWLQFRMAIQVIGWRRLPEILARERYIRKQQTNAAGIYVWFIAAQADLGGLDGILDLKKALFEKSYREQLPILMETTVKKVALTFQRYGFTAYHEWKPAQRDVQVWFLKRLPTAENIPSTKAQWKAVA